MIKPAKRTEKLKYEILGILRYAKQAEAAGKEMLYLNIGDPMHFDYETPRHLVEAAHRAMLDSRADYCDSSGIEEAREAIARDYARKGITDYVDLFVTSGVTEGIELCLTALINPGDEILLPCPGYPLYPMLMDKLEAKRVDYYLDESNDWNPDIDDIKKKITPKTRALVLVNPNNPTGSQYARDILEQVIKLSLKYNFVIFSDEIYERMILDGDEHISIASMTNEVPAVTMNGLSKAYLVPGYRIGWAAITGKRKELAEYIEAIHKLLIARLCAPTPLQYIIKPALEGPQDHLEEMRRKLLKRRDITYDRLNAIPGVTCVKPTAAFYAYPSLDIEEPDEQFVADLIMETGVVVVHGEGFGQRPGTRHVRIVFLPQEEILDRAYTLFEQFMSKRRRKH